MYVMLTYDNTPYNNLDEKLQFTVLIPLLALSLAAGSIHYQLILYQLITLLYVDGNDVTKFKLSVCILPSICFLSVLG